MTWRLGLLTDKHGHAHLGAVVPGDSQESEYIDLLAPVDASNPAELNLDQLVVLVRGEQVADLRRLAGRCIEDPRLRDRLIELSVLAGVHTVTVPWRV